MSPSTIGTPMEPSNLSRRFDDLRTGVGPPWLRLHDLRHACATFLLAQGWTWPPPRAGAGRSGRLRRPGPGPLRPASGPARRRRPGRRGGRPGCWCRRGGGSRGLHDRASAAGSHRPWCTESGTGAPNGDTAGTNHHEQPQEQKPGGPPQRDGPPAVSTRRALGRIRTCNLLIRSQVLYPLSYERIARQCLTPP